MLKNYSACVEALNSFAQLKKGWYDNEQGEPIDASTRENAFFLLNLLRNKINLIISPTLEGNIQIEYTEVFKDGEELEIEIEVTENDISIFSMDIQTIKEQVLYEN